MKTLEDGGEVDENEFMESSLAVFNGVREVREAVLLNRSAEEPESESEASEASETLSSSRRSSASKPPPSPPPPIVQVGREIKRFKIRIAVISLIDFS